MAVTPPPPGTTTGALFDGVGETTRYATFSDDGRYRYDLGRRWGPRPPVVTFVGLNPSIADADRDDMTVSKCVGFARRWGFDAMRIVNLHALVATNPNDLLVADDPVGPRNDEFLVRAAVEANRDVAPFVVAWGGGQQATRRVEAFLYELDPGLRARIVCLGITGDGSPRHPSRIGYNAEVVPWP